MIILGERKAMPGRWRANAIGATNRHWLTQ
jgi:hypothetical protein